MLVHFFYKRRNSIFDKSLNENKNAPLLTYTVLQCITSSVVSVVRSFTLPAHQDQTYGRNICLFIYASGCYYLPNIVGSNLVSVIVGYDLRIDIHIRLYASIKTGLRHRFPVKSKAELPVNCLRLALAS